MQIVVAAGNRELKLTKSERTKLLETALLCQYIARDYPELREVAMSGCDMLMQIDKEVDPEKRKLKPLTAASK